MKKLFTMVAILFTSFLALFLMAENEIWLTDYNKALEMGKDKNKPYFIFLYASPHKKSMEYFEKLSKDSELMDLVKKHFIMVKLDRVKKSNEDFFKQYGIYLVPSIMLQSADLKDKVVLMGEKDLNLVKKNIKMFLGLDIQENATEETNVKKTVPYKYKDALYLKIIGTGKYGDGKAKYKGATIYVKGTDKNDIGKYFWIKIIKDYGKYKVGYALGREVELPVGSVIKVFAKSKSRKGNDAVGYVKGKIVFIKNGVPGKWYKVKITKSAPTFCVATIIEELK